MKTTDEQLNKIWDSLEDIFMDYKGLSLTVCRQLEGLGFRVEKTSKHSKIYMPIRGQERMMVVSNTPSDKHAGRQILRQIRRMYER